VAIKHPTDCLDFSVERLGSFSAAVLDNTPTVLSVGRLISSLRADFRWCFDSYESPTLTLVDGTVVTFEVLDFVPVFDENKASVKEPSNIQSKALPVRLTGKQVDVEFQGPKPLAELTDDVEIKLPLHSFFDLMKVQFDNRCVLKCSMSIFSALTRRASRDREGLSKKGKNALMSSSPHAKQLNGVSLLIPISIRLLAL
jgi:hypothetical protein